MAEPRPMYHQYQPHLRPPETWTLTLDRYQRDNLLLLLNACGYEDEAIEPMHFWNTGDWLGEIVNMLAKVRIGTFEPQRPVFKIDSEDHPNTTRESIAVQIEKWRAAPSPSASDDGGGVRPGGDDQADAPVSLSELSQPFERSSPPSSDAGAEQKFLITEHGMEPTPPIPGTAKAAREALDVGADEVRDLIAYCVRDEIAALGGGISPTESRYVANRIIKALNERAASVSSAGTELPRCPSCDVAFYVEHTEGGVHNVVLSADGSAETDAPKSSMAHQKLIADLIDKQEPGRISWDIAFDVLEALERWGFRQLASMWPPERPSVSNGAES